MANEKRLISYDALITHLDSCIEQGKGLFKSVCVAIKCFVEQMPTVDAYTEEQVDSIIQKADLLEIENRNLEQEVDWLKNCLSCEIRNKCPRHCGKVVHGCDHWIDGDPMVHGRWALIEEGQNTSVYQCSKCKRMVNVVCDRNLRERQLAKNYPYCNCGAKMDGERRADG